MKIQTEIQADMQANILTFWKTQNQTEITIKKIDKPVL